MNIFLIVRGFPTESDPQWGNFEFDQARALAAKGHKVTMLSVDVRLKKRKYKITKIESESVTSYDLYYGPWVLLRPVSSTLYDTLKKFLLMKLFKYVIKREGMPEIIYTHYLDSADYAIPLKNKFNIPIVGLEHWSELGKSHPNKRVLKKANKVYPQLDQLLVVSNSLKENIKHYTNISSIVLPNVIGKEFIKTKDRENTTGVLKFVSTGNLIKIKNMSMIINAFKSLISEGYKADVTIVGAGPERDALRSLINQYSLDPYIHLVGRKTRTEIVDILNSSDVYIMASSSETFGVAAAEALACGLPVIATDCGGPRDFISKSNGIMIPIKNQAKLTEAMIYMIQHYEEYDRTLIANDFHKRFSAEAVADQLTEIFCKICQK